MKTRKYGQYLLDVSLNSIGRFCFIALICGTCFFPKEIQASQNSVEVDTVLSSSIDSNVRIEVDSISGDSLFVDVPVLKKNFMRAAGGLLLVEVIPWSYSYFITKTDFAKVSFKSLKRHIPLSSWKWDNDGFTTNQFSHPYHGSLYFNSFRANGYSLLPSAAATLSGSLIWEIAGETQAPAPNDLVNTTFGGIVLGEMIHRLANKLVNNTSRGLKRKVNEVAALLINPMNGLNRIVDGKWGKPPSGNDQIDSSKIDAQFDIGIRPISEKRNMVNKGENALYGRARFLYMNGSQRREKPFDVFRVDMEVGVDDSALVNTLSVYGLIYGRELLENDRVTHQAILSANYDLFHNSSFFYGGQSVNANVMSEFKLGSKSRINTTLGIGPVILAAVPDRYLKTKETIDDERNYDYGSGLSLSGNITFDIIDRIKLSTQYTGGIIKTISGNHSNYSLHALSSELCVTFVKDISINLSSGFFNVHGKYRNFPDLKSRYSFGRISIGYHVIF